MYDPDPKATIERTRESRRRLFAESRAAEVYAGAMAKANADVPAIAARWEREITNEREFQVTVTASIVESHARSRQLAELLA